MANKSRSRAFNVVRAAVRLRLLTARLREIDPEIPIIGDAQAVGNLSEPTLMKISLACSSLRNSTSFSRVSNGTTSRSRAASDAQVALLGTSPREDGVLPSMPAERMSSWVTRDFVALREIICASWLNLLLVVVPLALAAGLLHWGPIPVFVLNFLALIPLSLVLGDITEDLGLRFGDTIGGLLNATFGNVIEIIVSISALEKGLYTVVATSLLGSILSNSLLVLGMCFLFGGIYYKNQTYNAVSNRAASSLLFLATVSIFIPTAAAHIIPNSEGFILPLSRACAIMMLFAYGCYIYFQLGTHHDDVAEDDTEEVSELETHLMEDLEHPMLTSFTAISALAAISLTVAAHSEYLTGALEAVSQETGLGEAFLGMIVLPIAGNACEHLTAVIVACKNKMDLSLGIAVGSSIQIALFAIPLAVVVGWGTGHDFSLNFDFFSVLILILSVSHTNVVTADASSHWLQGVTLIIVYIMIACTYFFRE